LDASRQLAMRLRIAARQQWQQGFLRL